ncbi:hypothetical protein L9F63_019613, partial [Diploptera punctata]
MNTRWPKVRSCGRARPTNGDVVSTCVNRMPAALAIREMAQIRSTNPSYTLPHTKAEETNRPVVRIEEPALRRPVSLYDNLQRRGSGSLVSNSASIGNIPAADSGPPATIDRAPSQANCMTTTVPQNIAATNIGGKHVPTRNSLRHSRMIVLNRNGKA